MSNLFGRGGIRGQIQPTPTTQPSPVQTPMQPPAMPQRGMPLMGTPPMRGGMPPQFGGMQDRMGRGIGRGMSPMRGDGMDRQRMMEMMMQRRGGGGMPQPFGINSLGARPPSPFGGFSRGGRR